MLNLDAIKQSSLIIITEGEFDCMAIDQVGFPQVVSVPNGASLGNNKMEWLDNSIEYFEQAEKIIIATDKDNAGVNLRTQLSSRLGIERCYKVEFGDCKDANEVLVKHGEDTLKQIINSAEPFPIEGAFTVIDVENEGYFKGQAKLLYDDLKCKKNFMLFTKEEGAEEHCQVGAKLIAGERIFNWIETILNKKL